jgi:hypothetical protein
MISQTGDLVAAHRVVKFSCHFTLTEYHGLDEEAKLLQQQLE